MKKVQHLQPSGNANEHTLRFHQTTVRIIIIKKNAGKIWLEKELLYTLGGRKISPATMEISTEVPQKIKNTTTISPSYTTSLCIAK
jgi:hypothetical protein